jgi:hypothetical protein
MGASVIKQESTQTVVNARAELGRATTWLEDFIASAGLRDDLNSRLLVVLDEVLSNVVNHALLGRSALRLRNHKPVVKGQQAAVLLPRPSMRLN